MVWNIYNITIKYDMIEVEQIELVDYCLTNCIWIPTSRIEIIQKGYFYEGCFLPGSDFVEFDIFWKYWILP